MLERRWDCGKDHLPTFHRLILGSCRSFLGTCSILRTHHNTHRPADVSSAGTWVGRPGERAGLFGTYAKALLSRSFPFRGPLA